MRQVNKYISVITLLLFAAIITSCEHRPLEDISNTHYVRVYLDENLKNVTYGFYNPNYQKPAYNTPEVMRIMLCDPKTGKKVADRYLQNRGKDNRGNYLDGYILVDPGKYDVLTYNFGTPTTILRNENDFNQIEAYTNPIPPMMYSVKSRADINPEDIVYDPDHLFVDTQKGLDMKFAAGIDTIYNGQHDYYTARSLVKTYYLQVKVKGIEWIVSMNTLLTGMAKSVKLSNGEISKENPAVLSLDMRIGDKMQVQNVNAEKDPNDKESSITEEGYIYTTFSTFGKIPDIQSLYNITFEFVKESGETQSVTIDITDLFKTKDAIENQWLLIDKEIEITPPQDFGDDGGFTPGVDDWEDNETDVII